MKKFTFAVVFSRFSFEKEVEAETEKQAHKLVWDSLTDEERDNCECLDCVDEVQL